MFPLSDHSSDIIRALEQQMKKAGVKIHLGSRVKRLLVEKEEDANAKITGIQLDNGEKIRANRYWLPLAVILTRPQAPPGTDTGWQKRVVIP